MGQLLGGPGSQLRQITNPLVLALVTLLVLCTSSARGDIRAVVLMLTNPNIMRPMLAPRHLAEPHAVDFIPRYPPIATPLGLTASHLTSPLGGVDVLATVDSKSVREAIGIKDTTIDLSPIFQELKLVDTLPSALLDLSRGYRGQFRRLPVAGGADKLICNRTLLANAGWSPGDDWETGKPLVEDLESFVALLSQARSQSPNNSPQLRIGQDTTHIITLLLLLMGGQKTTEAIASGEVSFKSELISNWLQALVTLRPEVLVGAHRAMVLDVIMGRSMCVYGPTSLLNTFRSFPQNNGRLIFSTIPPPKGYNLIYSPGEWLRVPATAVLVWTMGVQDPYSSNTTEQINYLRAMVQSEMSFYDDITPSSPRIPGPYHMLVPIPKVSSLPPQFDHVLTSSRILQSTEALITPFSASAHKALAAQFSALGQKLFQDSEGTLTSSKYGDPLPPFDIANFTATIENLRLTEVLSTTPPPVIRSSATSDGRTAVEIVPERPGDIIRYTIDGSPPSLTSPLYTAPLEFARSGEVLVRATARRDGLATSADVSRVISLPEQTRPGASTTVVTILVLLAVLVTIGLVVALGLMARKWARLRRTKKALQLEAEAARVENENRLEAMVKDLRTEIDKREEAETLLKRESQFKSQFIGNMSHELRTPINGILLGAGLLGMSTLTEHQRSVVKTIDSSVALLLGLVNDILDAAKMDEGGLEPRYRRFNFLDSLYRCINILETRANDRGITLAAVIHPGTPREVVTDSDRLGQCLINLLTNAIKFTQRGGSVVLTVAYHRAWGAAPAQDSNPQPPASFYDGVVAPLYPAKDDGNADASSSAKLKGVATPPPSSEYLGPPDPTGVLVLEVRDTGMGIPESAHRLLFQRFSQVDPSDSRSHGGSGLGLYISRELVQRLGGGIGVKTKSNIGSNFALWLPISAGGTDGPSSTVTSSSNPASRDATMAVVLERVIGQVRTRIGRKPLILVMLNDPIHSTIACMMIQNRWKSNVELLEVHSAERGTGESYRSGSGERRDSGSSSVLEAAQPYGSPLLGESTRNDFSFPPWPVEPEPVAAPLGRLCTTLVIRAQSLAAAMQSCKEQVDMLPSVIILSEELLGSEDLKMFRESHLNGTGPYLILAKPSMKQSCLETLPEEQTTDFASVIRSIDLPLQEEVLFPALDACLSAWADRELQRATSNRPGVPALHRSASQSPLTSPSAIARRHVLQGRSKTGLPLVEELENDDHDERHAVRDARVDAILLAVDSEEGGVTDGASDLATGDASDIASDMAHDSASDDDAPAADGDHTDDGPSTVPPMNDAVSSLIESSTALTTLSSQEIKAGLEAYRKARANQVQQEEEQADNGNGTGCGIGTNDASTGSDRPMRVLLAEDNVVNAKLLIKVLARFNADVTHAWNGEEAYEMYKGAKVPFDVVLMDLQMPLCTGQESAILIRAYEAQNGIPQVLLYALTATTVSGDLREFLYDAGFDGLYSKPLMIPTVKKMMKDLRRKLPESTGQA